MYSGIKVLIYSNRDSMFNRAWYYLMPLNYITFFFTTNYVIYQPNTEFFLADLCPSVLTNQFALQGSICCQIQLDLPRQVSNIEYRNPFLVTPCIWKIYLRETEVCFLAIGQGLNFCFPPQNFPSFDRIFSHVCLFSNSVSTVCLAEWP